MSKSNEGYIIHDMDGFIEGSRRVVFISFDNSENLDIEDGSLFDDLSPEEVEELESILSFQESKNIILSLVKEKTNPISGEKAYFINDKIYTDILESLNTRMISNILMNLTKKGIVDTAYDSTLDDFVFWIKNENNTDQKPETD